MFELRDEFGNVLATAASPHQAEAALEEQCAKAHAQAVTNAEGTTDTWHRFEIVDTTTGETIMFRHYNPDPDQPYRPLTDEENQ